MLGLHAEHSDVRGTSHLIARLPFWTSRTTRNVSVREMREMREMCEMCEMRAVDELGEVREVRKACRERDWPMRFAVGPMYA